MLLFCLHKYSWKMDLKLSYFNICTSNGMFYMGWKRAYHSKSTGILKFLASILEQSLNWPGQWINWPFGIRSMHVSHISVCLQQSINPILFCECHCKLHCCLICCHFTSILDWNLKRRGGQESHLTCEGEDWNVIKGRLSHWPFEWRGQTKAARLLRRRKRKDGSWHPERTDQNPEGSWSGWDTRGRDFCVLLFSIDLLIPCGSFLWVKCEWLRNSFAKSVSHGPWRGKQ